MDFGLCVVGCGGYTQMVMEEFLDLPEKVNLFFASRDLQKSKEYAQKYKATDYFGDYEHAARDPRVNAMYFITPHDVHLENVKLATKYKKYPDFQLHLNQCLVFQKNIFFRFLDFFIFFRQ